MPDRILARKTWSQARLDVFQAIFHFSPINVYRCLLVLHDFHITIRFFILWMSAQNGSELVQNIFKSYVLSQGHPAGLFSGPKIYYCRILETVIFQKKGSPCFEFFGLIFSRSILPKAFIWTIRTMLVFGENRF